MINKEKTNILIIDKDTHFSKQMSLLLQQYKFHVSRLSTKEEILNYLQNNEIKYDLVILNINCDDIQNINIFDEIIFKKKSKIIVLSSEDIGTKREEYFLKGIIDYHLTDKKIDHIVDDIAESIATLTTNKNETILIIDSDKILCKQIAYMLECRNYNVFTAITSRDGLEILKFEEVSLLVLDMDMTDIASLDLMEGLRDMYLLNELSIFGISSNDTPSVVRDVLKGGAKYFLKKPFYNEEFVLKIDILIKSSRTQKTIINQNHQIENNLKQFKELLDASIGAMFIFEKDICINCNNEAITLLGYSSKIDILDKEIFEIFNDISVEHKNGILNNSIDYYFEDTITSNNLVKYDVQFKEKNIYIDNKVVKIIALLDVTDLKKKDKILSQQTKLASMGEMIGNIAHQWRQPLTAIAIAAGGIKLNYELGIEDQEETSAELDNIVENTKFLSSTIESFQNYLKTDKITTEFDVVSTIAKTLAIISANLKSHGIKVIEKHQNAYFLSGVENELVQVFLNIINNAADVLKTLTQHVKEKYIVITSSKSKKCVKITIQDNANGIPSDIISKVFDPYFTTKHQSQGTGLGLYMTHQIIEKMGGTLKVENETFVYENKKYKGANFSITLPLVDK